MHRKSVLMLLGVAALTATVPVFAESAPVYDVDTIEDQFESAEVQEQDLPPPPPPGQENMFVQPRSSVRASSSPAVVVSPSEMPIDQRIRRVEQQVNNLQAKTSNALVESLQTEIQHLRGQLEQLTHKLDQMETQQKTLYADLDKRLDNPKQQLAAKSAAPSTETEKTIKSKTPEKEKSVASQQPNVAEEQEIYQTAYNLIKEKKYEDAVHALQTMLQKYPTGQFASNAHYWLGELYGLMNNNDQALSEFQLVVKRYPDSPRVSDAQFKIGLIYATESKWSEAKAAFKKVINRYPGSSSSRLASQQLKQISEAGH